jgi:hypothetical protein
MEVTWTGLVKHVIEGKIEGLIKVTGRWDRRRRQLLDDLKEMREYCKLKAEALDRTLEDAVDLS